MGQTAHPGRPAGRLPRRRLAPAVALLALLGAGPLLSGCGSPLTSATTTLAGAVDALVVHPDGNTVGGVDGLKLRRGDVVRTGPHGRAELHTRGRVVYTGSQSSVQVVNGAVESLRHGAVVVDAQRGPGVTLQVASLSVAAPAGTAMRAERDATTRIGALAGNPTVDSDTGRQLRLSALSQVVVGGDALPNSTQDTPLRLTDDDGEARAVPTLVRDDLALDALAAGVDSTGAQTYRVVTAAWHQSLDPLPQGVGRSEQVLPLVIAAAATGSTPDARYKNAVGLRTAGGSWGVVAHLLGTDSAAVLAALQAFERGAATGQVGTVPAALSFVADAVHPGASGNSGGGGTTPQVRPSPGSSPTPGRTPAPSQSPNPVSSTLDKVLSLVPTPLPTVTSLLPSVQVPQLPAVQLPVTVPSLPVVGNVVKPAPLPTLGH
jgi:hypothetical protein